MALDKLIKEGNEIGGLIESIILAPQEGLGLILEIINLGVKYTKDITILDGEGVDITRAELLWGGKGIDKTEHTKALIQRWYKITITVTYKDIPLCIVKPKLDVLKPKEATGWTEPETLKEEKKEEAPVEKNEEIPVLNDIVKSWKVYDDPPKPPKPPLGRIIKEGTIGICDECGSSLKTKFFFFKTGGCIQPECENYWDKD